MCSVKCLSGLSSGKRGHCQSVSVPRLHHSPLRSNVPANMNLSLPIFLDIEGIKMSLVKKKELSKILKKDMISSSYKVPEHRLKLVLFSK